MVLSRRLHSVQPQIIVACCHVAQATSLKYFGVTVSLNLSWSAHIDNTCAKARKQLGLFYQHFHPAGRKALSRPYKIHCFAPAGLLCLCVGPHHTTYINKLKVKQRFAAKLDTGLWFPGCQDPIQIMNWLPLACCMPKRAKAAAVQTYSAWFNHTTLSIDSSPPPFSQAPSVYGIVLSYHKNICPSSLLLPKCCDTMEQAVIWPHLCSLTSYVKASFKLI